MDTFISAQEKPVPTLKAAKMHVTLNLGGNARGDFKLKPLLIYTSANPRTLKGMYKMTLPVVYAFDKKAWITARVNFDYMKTYVGPAISMYKSKNLNYKALLLVDNTPAHSKYMEKVCLNIKVIYLPPVMMSVLQPMNQGIITTCQAYYLRRAMWYNVEQMDKHSSGILETWKHLFLPSKKKAWHEVTAQEMNRIWRAIWPEAVNDYKEFSTAQAAGIDSVDEEGILKVLALYKQTLMTEELGGVIATQSPGRPAAQALRKLFFATS